MAMQQTLVVIKPDGVQRGLVGPILTRFEQRGYRIIGLKLLVVPREMAEKHYAVHQTKPFFGELVNYISSGPVVAMVLEGFDAIKAVRLMVGATRPYEAAPGTIRGDYAQTPLRNLIHASDAPDTSREEIALWFPGNEVQEYQRDLDKWVYE
ncbi:MAG TPA: nucleoside-diphosphate kinase [Chloroflexota bacterium]|nr:nucleoside-diphosphate kinase [Chloroflexota bacterium]